MLLAHSKTHGLMNPIVILLFNYSIVLINQLSLGPSIGSSDHSSVLIQVDVNVFSLGDIMHP